MSYRYRYYYNGPVYSFDKIVQNRWRVETIATSEKKARSNLAFRYKRESGLAPNANITLQGDITKGEVVM